MQVEVKLFGMVKMLTGGQASMAVDLDGQNNVHALVELFQASYPEVGELIANKKVLISVNQEIAHPDTIIQPGDEVALLPPFAGGCTAPRSRQPG